MTSARHAERPCVTPSNTDTPARFGTVEDVARIFQVHPNTIRRHADEFGAVRVGRAIRFDIERLLGPDPPEEAN